ncbi:MAG TPA: SRPBCC domain-containing protein [Verrucomicrobiae bacterium]|nr:SRPBCC domain-containing protein [Verrucomicrobiae bacterium]
MSEQLAATPIVIERTFDAPVATVWKAITDLDEMRQWYFPSIPAFKAEVGFETQVNVSHNGEIYPHLWKVTEVKPGKKISYSWRYGGAEGDSLVSFELFDEGGKTRLKLTHSGLETFKPEANPKYARKNFFGGWSYLVGICLDDFLQRNTPMPDRDFIISREFDAPRELVWKAWTDPKHMAQWWGPHQFTNPVCQMDVRPGGEYRIVMRAPDGTEYPGKGIFHEVVKPERLVMTMDHSELPPAWHDLVNPERDKTKPPQLDSVMTITFESIGGKTKLTVRSRFESMAIRDAMKKMGMTEGWSQSLERLTDLLKKM